jgi:hypothetical protein
MQVVDWVALTAFAGIAPAYGSDPAEGVSLERFCGRARASGDPRPGVPDVGAQAT